MSGSTQWKGLDVVFSHRPRRQRSHVAVLGASGGAGASTIAASLGRRMMTTGRSVLLVDPNEVPMLPRYFGAREFGGGVCTLLDTQATQGGRVQLVVKGMAAGAGSDWLRSGIAQAGDSVDTVIADAGTRSDDGWDSSLTGTRKHLVVLMPDLRSAIAIPGLLQEADRSAQRAGRPVQQAYVLNQFRPEARLHKELRARFADQLGDRYLGELRWSELVAEAVAQGQTIFDYAPDSESAEEFTTLSSVIEGLFGQPFATAAASAGR